jgi:hypothetical protein
MKQQLHSVHGKVVNRVFTLSFLPVIIHQEYIAFGLPRCQCNKSLHNQTRLASHPSDRFESNSYASTRLHEQATYLHFRHSGRAH